MNRSIAAILFLLLPAASASATPEVAQPVSAQVDFSDIPNGVGMRRIDQDIVESEGFVSSHPDLVNRHKARVELNRQNLPAAITYLRRAANYGDKVSQAIMAELLWSGDGIEQDRALAYAWMDLAAERGSLTLLAKREAYWQQLSPEEQARALAVGQEVYAHYGDEVAQPRQERIMLRERRKSTDSRLGKTGLGAHICLGARVDHNKAHEKSSVTASIECEATVDSSAYYHDRFWEPEQYWAWQAEVIEYTFTEGRGRMPHVEVGSATAPGN